MMAINTFALRFLAVFASCTALSRLAVKPLLTLSLLFPLAFLVACGPKEKEAPDSAQVVSDTVKPPAFSHLSGFYAKGFKLRLSSAPGTDIYYTLDGSVPDPDNLDGKTYRYKNSYQHPPRNKGEKVRVRQDNFLLNEYKTFRYSKPVLIRDRTTEPERISQISTTFDENPEYLPATETEDGKPLHRFKGTPVRAIAVLETEKGRLVSPVAGHTYFVGQAPRFELPVVALVIDETELYDYDTGRLVAGKDYDAWLAGLRGPESLHICAPGNFIRRSAAIAKAPGHAIFFQGRSAISLDAEFRTHGGCSRSQRSKSIRLYPQDKQAAAQVMVFADEPLSGYNINLRNSGESFTRDYMRDAVIHQLAQGLAVGTQRYAPFVVFINGEYNGILNARDRKDTRYLKHAYGVKRKEIDLLKKNMIVDSGSAEAYRSMLAEWEQANPKTREFLERAGQQVDLESFIDYNITSMYFAREDWPANNVAYWRVNGEASESIPTSDGRWRWLLYDADVSMANQKLNMLEYMTQEEGERDINAKWSTFMFRTLLRNSSFRDRFITRYSDLINSSFAPQRVLDVIQQTRSRIESEIPRQIERWQAPESEKEWRHYINQMETFARRRPAIQRQHIQDYFKLKGSYSVHVDVSEHKAGTVKLNTLHLGIPDEQLARPVAASRPAENMQEVLALPWQGEYFYKLRLRLEAVPQPGYRFVRWQAEGIELTEEQQRSVRLSLRPEEHFSIKAVFARG